MSEASREMPHAAAVPGRIGVIAIGRNEGQRLVRCLESLSGRGVSVVYVDSGSSDDSVANARRLGAEVVALDMSKPFSAARARNAGYARLRELVPSVEFVQFVDGDCKVADDWLAVAAGFLGERPEVVATCGRRRELFPDARVFVLERLQRALRHRVGHTDRTVPCVRRRRDVPGERVRSGRRIQPDADRR